MLDEFFNRAVHVFSSASPRIEVAYYDCLYAEAYGIRYSRTRDREQFSGDNWIMWRAFYKIAGIEESFIETDGNINVITEELERAMVLGVLGGTFDTSLDEIHNEIFKKIH